MIEWSIIGVAFVIYVFVKFILALGKGIPVLELMILIAGMQWIVGAYIEYRTSFQHFKYYMYVGESEYMSYVVPAYIIFASIVFFGLKKVNLSIDINRFSQYSKHGLVLVIIGFIAQFIRPQLPSGLQFVFFLFSNFKYVGAIILFFSNVKWHRFVLYFAIVYLGLGSLASGFFHEFIIWSTFFYMFWAYKSKPSFKFNLLVIVLGFFMGTIIQAVKLDYRSILASGYNGNYTSLFMNILNSRLSGGLSENVDEQSELNVRLNQGWIISAIMDNTPRVEPFAEGSTIKEAIFAAALPRFLNPSKKEATGRENFEKYTGITLLGHTSMGISLIGESYANFGRFGGILFMAFFGFLVVKAWLLLTKKTNKELLLVFFLPLIFLQVIKAESELLTVLNHFVKSSILVFVFIFILKKYIEPSEPIIE